jgi:hypothetical protein
VIYLLISQQIGHYLTFQGVARYAELGTDGNVYLDELPEGENLIGIYKRKAPQHIDSKLGFKFDGVQIIYRGSRNPVESMEKAEEIFEALHGFTGFFMGNDNLTWGGAMIEWSLLKVPWSGYPDGGENWIVSCLSPNGGVECLGLNKNRQHEYSMNFTIDYKK